MAQRRISDIHVLFCARGQVQVRAELMTVETSHKMLCIYYKCYNKLTYVVQLKWIIISKVLRHGWLKINGDRSFISWFLVPPAGQILELHTFTFYNRSFELLTAPNIMNHKPITVSRIQNWRSQAGVLEQGLEKKKKKNVLKIVLLIVSSC